MKACVSLSAECARFEDELYLKTFKLSLILKIYSKEGFALFIRNLFSSFFDVTILKACVLQEPWCHLNKLMNF